MTEIEKKAALHAIKATAIVGGLLGGAGGGLYVLVLLSTIHWWIAPAVLLVFMAGVGAYASYESEKQRLTYISKHGKQPPADPYPPY